MKTQALALTLALLTAFTNPSAHAEDPFGLPAESLPYKEMQATGDLVSIRIVPGNKETKLYIVGKETGTVKIEDMAVIAKVGLGENQKVVKFAKKKDYFSTTEEVQEDLHIRLENKSSQKIDEFKLKLQRP